MAEALLAQEHHDYMMQIREMERLQLEELHYGPTLAEGITTSNNTNTTANTVYSSNNSGVDTSTNISTTSGTTHTRDHQENYASHDHTAEHDAAMHAESVPAAPEKYSFANITQVTYLIIFIFV